MIKLLAKIRESEGKKTKDLREKGIIPAILYGPKLENLLLEVDLKEFEKVYQGAGESSLIELEVDKKKFMVLIHAVEMEAISQKPIHIDFYQPNLDEEIVSTVPLVFEGEAPAVKNLGGTLLKNIYEVDVRALPQNLPHEIKVDISRLETFEDYVLIKDLPLSDKVKVLKDPEETVVFVSEPEKVEEELGKTVEGKMEEIEKSEEKGKKEEKEEKKQE
jgi:large subunit ribosomal protein L25